MRRRAPGRTRPATGVAAAVRVFPEPNTRSRISVNRGSLRSESILVSTSKMNSVAEFSESGGILHELRKVRQVDGRQVRAQQEARNSLALDLKSNDDRVRRKLGHERRFRHAGLRVDLETHESPCPLDAVVVAKIRTAHTTAAQRAMRRQR